MEIRQARPMTARTLEEIEAISCGITYMSGHETYVCDPGEPCRKCLKRRVRAAVAIAQEQRAEIARLKRFEEIVIGSEKALAELVKNHKMPGPVFENCDPGFLKS